MAQKKYPIIFAEFSQQLYGSSKRHFNYTFSRAVTRNFIGGGSKATSVRGEFFGICASKWWILVQKQLTLYIIIGFLGTVTVKRLT